MVEKIALFRPGEHYGYSAPEMKVPRPAAPARLTSAAIAAAIRGDSARVLNNINSPELLGSVELLDILRDSKAPPADRVSGSGS